MSILDYCTRITDPSTQLPENYKLRVHVDSIDLDKSGRRISAFQCIHGEYQEISGCDFTLTLLYDLHSNICDDHKDEQSNGLKTIFDENYLYWIVSCDVREDGYVFISDGDMYYICAEKLEDSLDINWLGDFDIEIFDIKKSTPDLTWVDILNLMMI